MPCDDLGQTNLGVTGMEIQEGGDICILIADSVHLIAGTNTTL